MIGGGMHENSIKEKFRKYQENGENAPIHQPVIDCYRDQAYASDSFYNKCGFKWYKSESLLTHHPKNSQS